MSHESLTPAQAERLHLLIEECGETIQAATKALRHGYESYDPTVARSCRESNRQAVEREISHILAAVRRMVLSGDADQHRIDDFRDIKLERGGRWMHHQPDRPEVVYRGISDPTPRRPDLQRANIEVTLSKEVAASLDRGCRVPPAGWVCSRHEGHEGPCAAHKVDQ